MNNLDKSSIFSVRLLYINKIILISLILFNFNQVFAEVSNDEEPFQIWSESTNQTIPQLEGSYLEEEIVEEEFLDNESNNSEGILKAEFSYSVDDTIGLFDESNGGFSSDIWKGSSFKDIDYLIKSLPDKIINNEVNRLKLTSLLTIATPPADINQTERNFLQLKLDYFKSIGDYNSILAISELIDEEEWSESLIQGLINYNLSSLNYKYICDKKILNKIKSENLSLKIRVFCNAMSSNLPAIDLLISLIVEEESYDKELVYILNSYLNESEIDMTKIKKLDLFKLNLIENKKINYSNYINDESEIELQLFYINSTSKTDIKKVLLTEDLLLRGLVDPETLSNVYEKYLIESNTDVEFDFKNSGSDIESRIFLYNQIRKASNQEEIMKLASAYVSIMGSANLLTHSASLIYDKIKIIVPKQEYKDDASSICLLLLLNKDFDQCQRWLTNFDYIKDAVEIKTKIRFYVSLNSNTNQINESDIILLLSSKELSEKQKNILAKYAELRYQLNLIDYWKSENEFIEISTTATNIKLVEYLQSIPLENKGEMILLVSLIHGNKPTNMIDQNSLFLILKTLNRLNQDYLDNFVFEYFTNNQI